MSIETPTESGTANNQTSDEIESVPNPERGCGFLEDGKSYLRTDVAPGGDLPSFVEFAQPIPFKEDGKRSYKKFPGIQFELSVTGEAGLTSTLPEGEVHEHLARLENDRPTGTTAGEMLSFHSNDLLMSVGATYYEDVDDFVAEAKVHGVNKAISVTSGNHPPAVNPGRTRLFLIHPNAVPVTVENEAEVEVEKTEEVELGNGETTTISYTETEMETVEETEYVPGVFGYTYLTRVIYTKDSDGNVPKYIQDYDSTGDLDVVEAGPARTYDEQEGFDEDGELVGDAQEVLMENYPELDSRAFEMDDKVSFHDFSDLYPKTAGALEAPTLDRLEKADLGTLADMEEPVVGFPPVAGEDAHYGDENGALAIINVDDQMFKVMPSNNVSFDSRSETATSVVGPYRVAVEDRAPERIVTVTRTR